MLAKRKTITSLNNKPPTINATVRVIDLINAPIETLLKFLTLTNHDL